MYRIGEISKIVNISVSKLRYYDEVGILKPHFIDEDSRYRYYSDDQVKKLLLILELKKYSFSLDAIKTLIDEQSGEQLKNAFELKLQELQSEHQKIGESIGYLKRRIDSLETDNHSSRKNILIVDDSDFLRNILKKVLEDYGFIVVGEATNGQEGVHAFETLKPDVVILDIHMPVLDGIETLKRIKSIDADAKVLMCSAKAQMDYVLKTFSLGAYDFIPKPFRPEHVINAVNNSELQKVYNPLTLQSIKEKSDLLQLDDPNTNLSLEAIQQLSVLCNDSIMPSNAIQRTYLNDLFI